jgi:dihydroorotate dehydrogenase
LFDFFVVNVSSPNTPNLRQLQDKDQLAKILALLNNANEELTSISIKNQKPTPKKPILIKIAPDLSFEAIEEVLNLSKNISGIVATNTTITRPTTTDNKIAKIYAMEGGVSGKPLKNRSTEIIKFIYRQTQGKLPIIGVGGIFTPEDAWEKIAAGATLVQVYTGMIYEGPSIVKNIVEGVREILNRKGIKNISEAVGIQNNP